MEGYSNQPIPKEAAKKLLALDLEDKEILTYEKLDQWYTAWNGKCYVSFSGGKDSTVLAYLAARYLSSFRTTPYPLTLVFVNTGLEYPEIQKFVNEYTDWLRKKFPRVMINLTRLCQKMNIRQVVRKYEYSIVSKEVAGYVRDARRNPSGLRMKRLRGEAVRKDGQPSAYNCEKWEYLLYAPYVRQGGLGGAGRYARASARAVRGRQEWPRNDRAVQGRRHSLLGSQQNRYGLQGVSNPNESKRNVYLPEKQ